MTRILMVLALGAASGVFASPVDGPVLPYYDRGACPFECCTYRQWHFDHMDACE